MMKISMRIYYAEENAKLQWIAGREIVSASFVIPYPPGFPILVPGQVLSKEILEFFIKSRCNRNTWLSEMI